MGTLIALMPLVGILIGLITARLATSELKEGKKYFILLQHITLSGIAVVLMWQYNIVYASVAGILLFAILWKIKFEHPIALTPLLALAANYATVPILLYFIPTATLNRNTKKLVCIAGAYAIIIVLFETFKYTAI